MTAFAVPLLYITWHYSRGIRDYFGVVANLMWFVGNLFSVPTLLRTFATPLKLMSEDHVAFVNSPSLFFQNLLVNTMMRIVGMIARSAFIVMAFLGWSAILALAVVGFAVWLVLPALPIVLISVGLTHLV